MTDSDARSHVHTLEATQGQHVRHAGSQRRHSEMFNINVPPVLMSTLGSLATLPATWPANTEWVSPDRQPSPREPSSPRPPTPTTLAPGCRYASLTEHDRFGGSTRSLAATALTTSTGAYRKATTSGYHSTQTPSRKSTSALLSTLQPPALYPPARWYLRTLYPE